MAVVFSVERSTIFFEGSRLCRLQVKLNASHFGSTTVLNLGLDPRTTRRDCTFDVGDLNICGGVHLSGGLLRLPVEAQIQHAGRLLLREFGDVTAGTLVVLEVDCGDDTFQLTETASLQGAKLEPGSQVVSSGSPFGLLAPRHFAHSLTWGHVSNLWPSVDGFGNSLLMLDIRVLPGMEGGPVLDERGALIGLLLPPLLNTSTRTEEWQWTDLGVVEQVCGGGLLQIPLAISFEELLRSLRTFFAANTAQSDFWRSLKMWTRSTAG
eukprot:gene12451-14711_t